MKKLISTVLTFLLICGLCFAFAGCGDDVKHAVIRVKFDWPIITTDSDAIFELELSEENNSVELTVQYGQGHIGQGHKMTAEVVYYDEKYKSEIYPNEVNTWYFSIDASFYLNGDEPSPMQWYEPILECGKYMFYYEINKGVKEQFNIEPFVAYLYLTVV